MKGRRRATTPLLAAAALLAGCGVVAGGGPRAIPTSQVPFHLLTKVVPTTTSTTAPVATAPVTVYFVARNQQFLVKAQRAVPAPATLHTVLVELLAGPTAAERTTDGVRTAVTAGVRLLSVRPSVVKPTTDVITVNFNLAFSQISGTAQVQAVAQVVFTLKTLVGPQVAVQFQIQGSDTAVPTDTGAQAAGPVTFSQYETLTPTAPPTTTTTTTTAPGTTTTAVPAGG